MINRRESTNLIIFAYLWSCVTCDYTLSEILIVLNWLRQLLRDLHTVPMSHGSPDV